MKGDRRLEHIFAFEISAPKVAKLLSSKVYDKTDELHLWINRGANANSKVQEKAYLKVLEVSCSTP